MSPIVRLLVKRIGISLIVLIGVSLLIFAIARVIPGDPARIALGPNATVEAVAALREKLHLNDDFLTQYGYFLSELAHGNLGISLYTNRPVMQDIAQFLPATLELVIIAGIMMVGFALPLGMMAARYRDTWIDHTIRTVTLLGVSAPGFVWAVALMLIFAYFLPLFPIAGRISESMTVAPVTGFLLIDTLLAGNPAAFVNALWHLILPAFALSLAGIGQAARLIRSNMVETYKTPYIEMAQAFGAS
jgi:peptide/nickel transport system permease protein